MTIADLIPQSRQGKSHMSDFGFSHRTQVSSDDVEAYLKFAKAVARDAGRATLPFFRADVTVENKLSDGFDPVTEADKAAEQIVRSEIERAYPSHGIYGEEFGFTPGDGLTWVIDPIDGTKSFMTGLLHWGVLIGLFDGVKPILGVMYQPYTDELFFGDGSIAGLQNASSSVQLSTSTSVDLSTSIMATTGLRYYVGDAKAAFERLVDATRMCRLGGDCYLFAALGMGHLDIVTESSLKPYDIQALIPIIRGAGGVVTTFAGENPSMGGSVVASANEALHEAALDILRRY